MNASTDRIVVLTTLRTEMEAGLIVAALDEVGIAATITGETTSGFRAIAPGCIQVNVAAADQEQALNVLRQIEQDRESFDWSRAEYSDEEAEVDSQPSTGVGSLKLWRRIAQVLIVLYLIWLSFDFLASGAIIVTDLLRKTL